LAGPETDFFRLGVEDLFADDMGGALGVIEHHGPREIAHRGEANSQVDLGAVRVLGEKAVQREGERHEVVKGLNQVAEVVEDLAHPPQRFLKVLLFDADRGV
jgi:hypothetical protein